MIDLLLEYDTELRLFSNPSDLREIMKKHSADKMKKIYKLLIKYGETGILKQDINFKKLCLC